MCTLKLHCMLTRFIRGRSPRSFIHVAVLVENVHFVGTVQ